MSKKRNIASLYKILALYEDIFNENSPVTKESYLTYIDRTYVRWVGHGCEEISDILLGIKKLEMEIEHEQLKSMVFHMINLVKEGE